MCRLVNGTSAFRRGGSTETNVDDMKALTPNNELLQRSMHTLELHIWGPAFGLPSLHAECIAAVAFLKRVLQPEDWVVIPSYDTSSSPSSLSHL